MSMLNGPIGASASMFLSPRTLKGSRDRCPDSVVISEVDYGLRLHSKEFQILLGVWAVCAGRCHRSVHCFRAIACGSLG